MRAKGIIFTGLSALLYGLAPVLSAKTYQLGSDALTLTFYRELLVLPLLCVLTLALGWMYHITLGGEAMWVDIAIFVLVMALGFWLATRFSGPFKGVKWLLPILIALLLGGLIAWFTLYPPEGLLFRDLAAVGSWLPLPC